MNSKLLAWVVGLFVLILLAGLGFGYWKYRQNRVASYEFVGQIKKIDGQVLTLKGTFIINGKAEALDSKSQREVKITVTANTKIIKTALHLPTAEEVKATGGRYDPANLKKEETAGSLADLKDFENSIDVKTSKDIYGSSQFEAASINYVLPVYPR